MFNKYQNMAESDDEVIAEFDICLAGSLADSL